MKSVVSQRWIKFQAYNDGESTPLEKELGILGIEPQRVKLGSQIEKVSNQIEVSRIRKWQFNVKFMPFFVLPNTEENDLSDWSYLTELMFAKDNIVIAGTNQEIAYWGHENGLFGTEIGQISSMLVEPVEETYSAVYEKGYFEASIVLREK